MEATNILAFVKGIIYTLFIFLDIDTSIFYILLIFMILDTISGVIKVLKIDKAKFSFKFLMWGLVSKIGLLIIPLIVALLFKAIGPQIAAEGGAGGAKIGLDFGVDLIIKIIIVSEFLSTLGNIYTIKTGKIVKDIDIFSMLFKFLRCKGLVLLGRLTGQNLLDTECKAAKEEQKAEPKEGAENEEIEEQDK